MNDIVPAIAASGIKNGSIVVNSPRGDYKAKNVSPTVYDNHIETTSTLLDGSPYTFVGIQSKYADRFDDV